MHCFCMYKKCLPNYKEAFFYGLGGGGGSGGGPLGCGGGGGKLTCTPP